MGVLLFNFGEIDFEINMGDKIAHLICERIKTPAVLEVDSLENTNRVIKDLVQPVSRLPQNQSIQ